MPIKPDLEYEARLATERSARSALCEMMIASTPHEAATRALVEALEPFPTPLLLAASRLPTRIWLLDDDERVSSAAILTERMRRRRWHQHLASIDDYLGLTDVGPGYVAMVTRWTSGHVIRHEFGHVVTALLSAWDRQRISDLFLAASRRGCFIEPLASRSVGEYVACGIAAYVTPARQPILRELDQPLALFLDRLFARFD